VEQEPSRASVKLEREAYTKAKAAADALGMSLTDWFEHAVREQVKRDLPAIEKGIASLLNLLRQGQEGRKSK
jgi:hypothetical protein